MKKYVDILDLALPIEAFIIFFTGSSYMTAQKKISPFSLYMLFVSIFSS